MSPKDFASLLIAVMALLISGTTAYYNLFRTKVDVKAYISPSEWGPEYDVENDSLTNYRDTVTLTIVNGGNRPVGITGIKYFVAHLSKKDHVALKYEDDLPTRYCEELHESHTGPMVESTVPIEEGSDLFVVKPGDIATSRIRVSGGAGLLQTPDEKPLEIADFYDCLSLTYVLPGTAPQTKTPVIHRTTVYRGEAALREGSSASTVPSVFAKGEAIILDGPARRKSSQQIPSSATSSGR